MAKGQNKAAADLPQDVNTMLPEEDAEQLSIIPEEGTVGQETQGGDLPEGDADLSDPGSDQQLGPNDVRDEGVAPRRTLDRSKPFGEVFGGGMIGFEQDGYYFDRAGNQIDPEA